MFTVRDGSAPLYQRLSESVKQSIRDGIYRPGDRLPTIRALAAELLVNANTVARAYQTLEREGVIETTVGRGTFIATQEADPGEMGAMAWAMLDIVRRLRRAGWSPERIESWCVSLVRASEEGVDS